MEKIKEIFAYFNPMFFYYSATYVASKVFQLIFGTESVWIILWNKFFEVFGDSEAFHIIWFSNLYAFFLYWTFGALLMTMQKLKIPKSLENFKIQSKNSEIEKSENFFNVRISASSLGRSKLNEFLHFHCIGYQSGVKKSNTSNFSVNIVLLRTR